MVRAVAGLKIKPDLVLIDGNKLPKKLAVPARAIVKGDATVPAILAPPFSPSRPRRGHAEGEFPPVGIDEHGVIRPILPR